MLSRLRPMPTSLASIVVTMAALAAMGGTVALAQTSPARGAPASPDDVPLADYLGLLGQIAPAAEAGARDYLSAYLARCGRTIGSAELRRAMTQGDGDPVLMGLIRANHLQDAAARTQWTYQMRCSQKGTR